MLTISGVLKVLLSEVCSVSMPAVEETHIHLLTHHLFMGQHHFDGLPMSIGLAFQALIKAGLLHPKLVRQVLLQ